MCKYDSQLLCFFCSERSISSLIRLVAYLGTDIDKGSSQFDFATNIVVKRFHHLEPPRTRPPLTSYFYNYLRVKKQRLSQVSCLQALLVNIPPIPIQLLPNRHPAAKCRGCRLELDNHPQPATDELVQSTQQAHNSRQLHHPNKHNFAQCSGCALSIFAPYLGIPLTPTKA
jgi:hypothetical protein